MRCVRVPRAAIRTGMYGCKLPPSSPVHRRASFASMHSRHPSTYAEVSCLRLSRINPTFHWPMVLQVRIPLHQADTRFPRRCQSRRIVHPPPQPKPRYEVRVRAPLRPTLHPRPHRRRARTSTLAVPRRLPPVIVSLRPVRPLPLRAHVQPKSFPSSTSLMSWARTVLDRLDFACLCTNVVFQGEMTACLVEKCTLEDMEDALKLEAELCPSYCMSSLSLSPR